MSKPPGSRPVGRGTGPRPWLLWFRLGLLLRRGSAQPAWKGRSWLSQLVSGASGCVETTGQLNGGSDHRFPIVVVLVSTRAAPTSRPGSTSFERDGLDSICSLALADRLNRLREGQSWLSRVVRNERPVSKPSGGREADLSSGPRGWSSWARLNRLRERQSRLNQLWGSDGEERKQETHEPDQ